VPRTQRSASGIALRATLAVRCRAGAQRLA